MLNILILIVLSSPLLVFSCKANKGNLAGLYILYLILYIPALFCISENILIIILGYSFTIVNSLYFREKLGLINWLSDNLNKKK